MLEKLIALFKPEAPRDKTRQSLDLFGELSLFLYEFVDTLSPSQMALFLELAMPVYSIVFELNLAPLDDEDESFLVLGEFNKEFFGKYKRILVRDCLLSSEFIKEQLYYGHTKVIKLGALYNSTLIAMPGLDGINLNDDGLDDNEIQTDVSYKNLYCIATAQLLIDIYIQKYQGKTPISAQEFYKIEFYSRINGNNKTTT